MISTWSPWRSHASAAALEHGQRARQHRAAVSAQAPAPDDRSACPTLAEAKRRDRSTCASVSTLIAKCSAASNAGRLGLSQRSDHCTSGGSSDSALNELTVRPTGVPAASRQVASVTPVAKRPSAERRAADSAPAFERAARHSADRDAARQRHAQRGADQRAEHVGQTRAPSASDHCPRCSSASDSAEKAENVVKPPSTPVSRTGRQLVVGPLVRQPHHRKRRSAGRRCRLTNSVPSGKPGQRCVEPVPAAPATERAERGAAGHRHARAVQP